MSLSGTPPTQLTIAIVGAAIAGPTFALQILSHPILRQRFKPVLYDRSSNPFLHDQQYATSNATRRPQLQTAGAAIALFANGLYPLYQLGLKDDLKRIGVETPCASSWRSTYGTIVKDSEDGDSHAVADKPKYLATMKHAGWAEDLQSYLVPMERRDLQMLLLKRVKDLGGEIRWDRKLKSLERCGVTAKIRLLFENMDESTNQEETVEADLVVGADGSFSKVRRFVLDCRDSDTAEQKWMPDFFKACGIYGISSKIDGLESVTDVVSDAAAHTHGIWLPEGSLSSSPLPNGKIRWDLLLPDEKLPEQNIQISEDAQADNEEAWMKNILPGAYPRSQTIEILRKHAAVFHPVTGTFGRLFTSAERIIHGPLRQRIWEADEIHVSGDVVLIGDASRALLPSSGQGTSFAIEDATVLADAMLNNPFEDHCKMERALEEYAKTRTPRNKKIAQLSWQAGKFGLGVAWYWRWAIDLANMASHYGRKRSHDTWPFSDRYDVKLRTTT